jgi:hypothetical protein
MHDSGLAQWCAKEQTTMTDKKQSKNDAARAAILEAIAILHLDLETLETRKSDSLDFHDLGVASIASALEAAYEAGKAQGARS